MVEPYLKSALRSKSKLVQKIEVETSDGPEAMYFYYNANNDIERIKATEVSNYDKSKYEMDYVYSYSGNSLSCLRTIRTYDIKTGELQDTQIDGADCILDGQGYIIQEDDSEEDDKSVYSYEYENGYMQAYSYNNKKDREYTWIDGNVTMGGDYWDEYYTYSDAISTTNIYLPQLFMQTYGEDVFYFALIGKLGHNSKNLLSQYLRYDKKHNIEYQFDEEGNVIQMVDLYDKDIYTIYYDDTPNPDPTPAPQQPMKNSKVLSATLPKAPKTVLLKSLSPVMA